jgi:deoxyribonuclease-4
MVEKIENAFYTLGLTDYRPFVSYFHSFQLSFQMSAAPLRVRQVLDSLTPDEKKLLKKLLPSSVKMSDAKAGKYPSAILTAFGGSYSALGVIAENMLRFSPEQITLDALIATARTVWPQFSFEPFTTEIEQKIRKSKTNQPFLDCLVTTRRSLDAFIGGTTLVFEAEIGNEFVVGHPDARTSNACIEIKLTGQLLKNWTYFQLQLFSYAALDPECKDVYLVLPLHSLVIHTNLDEWKKRSEFTTRLNTIAQRIIGGGRDATGVTNSVTNTASAAGMLQNIIASITASALTTQHKIGHHIGKCPSLTKTLQELPRGVPSQIFLANPQSATIKISDMELAQAAAVKNDDQLFIHAPYIINLAADASYQIECLKTLLTYGATIGAAGVVVHVGKSTTQSAETAMARMRSNVAAVIPHACTECPLLLETPAGQGTEMLRSYEDFVGFVKSFDTPSFRLCVDTCHIFACGHRPLEYLTRLVAEDRDLLKLVHFNDSLDICGACKDRHAPVGFGNIGIDIMTRIAELCTSHKIPAVIE